MNKIDIKEAEDELIAGIEAVAEERKVARA